MKTNKVSLMRVYAFSTLALGSASIFGADIDEPATKLHRSEGGSISANVVDVRNESSDPRRSGSSHISEYEGSYVCSNSKGVVTIRQDKYPTYIPTPIVKTIKQLKMRRGFGLLSPYAA